MIKRLLDGWGPTRALKMRAFRAMRYARHRAEGERLLTELYHAHHGHPLDPERPELFTEKLFAWQIRLHRSGDRRFAPLADKLAVRDRVEKRLGPGFLPELYWDGKDPEQIPFNTLPEHYVIKPTHRSGDVFMGAEGLDRAQVVPYLKKVLSENFYWASREYQYLHIPPRVIVEEKIDDGTDGTPLDYSVWCFHGEPRLLQVRQYPLVINQFYGMDWTPLELQTKPDIPDIELSRPALLNELVEAGQRLSEGLEFARVDFYLAPERVVFSELTLSPAAGRARYQPPEWDQKLGAMWRWPGT